MEIRVLRYFITVAREENITKAAEKLHITQPTLSRQLHQLEEELGKTLLRRGNHDIKLTEDGYLLRKRAEEILDLVEKTETEMKSADEEIAGDIHIGAGETDAVRIVAKIVKILSFGKYNYVERVLRLAEDRNFSHENAKRDFGYLPEAFDIGLKREVSQYIEAKKK